MYRHKCAMNWRREITFEVKCRFYLIYGCYEYLLSVVDASVVLSNRVGKKGMKFPIKINTRNHQCIVIVFCISSKQHIEETQSVLYFYFFQNKFIDTTLFIYVYIADILNVYIHHTKEKLVYICNIYKIYIYIYTHIFLVTLLRILSLEYSLFKSLDQIHNDKSFVKITHES